MSEEIKERKIDTCRREEKLSPRVMNEMIRKKKKSEERRITISGSLIRRKTRSNKRSRIRKHDVINVSVSNFHVCILPFSVEDQNHAENCRECKK